MLLQTNTELFLEKKNFDWSKCYIRISQIFKNISAMLLKKEFIFSIKTEFIYLQKITIQESKVSSSGQKQPKCSHTCYIRFTGGFPSCDKVDIEMEHAWTRTFIRTVQREPSYQMKNSKDWRINNYLNYLIWVGCISNISRFNKTRGMNSQQQESK